MSIVRLPVKSSRVRDIASDIADDGYYSAGQALNDFANQYETLLAKLAAVKADLVYANARTERLVNQLLMRPDAAT